MSDVRSKAIKKHIKRAREQRNATTNNEDYDYWHGVYEYYTLLLKTEENK
jgi:hypothetical protein